MIRTVRGGPDRFSRAQSSSRIVHSDLIQVLAVLAGTTSEQPFLHGADFLERAVARVRSAPPRAPRAGARQPSSNANLIISSAPSWNTPVPQYADPIAKPHSAVPNPGFELAQLEDPDRRVRAVERHREADIRSRPALTQRPGDEPFEAVDRRRRRRDEARHFFRRQQRAERRRIRRRAAPAT